MKKFTLSLSLFTFVATIFGGVDITTEQIDQETHALRLHFTLDNNELVYKQSITLSIDTPYLELTEPQEKPNAVEKYDPTTKETRLVFDEDFTITLQAKKLKSDAVNGSLHVSYQKNNDPYPSTTLFPLNFDQEISKKSEQPTTSESSAQPATKIKHGTPSLLSHVYNKVQAWSQNLSTLVEQTNSLPIRLLLVFVLGILLSFTPCIYPMIPITVGILQAQKGSTVGGNFGRSFAYTLGLSMTFACFGLAASITGPIYGKLLMSPISVGILVSMLGFLGLSMFGLYDIQLPKFLQFKKENAGNGSMLSSFLFGAASGTIASPCVSPGLILLLSIVATLGNLFQGFLLLFSFGFGLSVPLLLIGTFSTSMNILPRAGLWMVEVKKFFGIMLFAVCFYYLNNILAQTTLMYLASFTLFSLGIYYLINASKAFSPGVKKFSNIFGFALLSFSVMSLGYSLQMQYLSSSPKSDANFWLTDYTIALDKARAENKLLFLDFWAEYCSICKAINKKIANDTELAVAVQTMVPVKINGTYDEEPFKSLKAQYNIVGFPTILVIDPTTGNVLKEWHSELYSLPKEQVVETLNGLTKSLK